VVLASIAVATFVVGHLKIPASMVATARGVILIGGVAMAITIVSGVFGGVVTAMQRFDLASGSQVGVGALRALAVVIVLSSGGGLIPLALVQFGQALLQAMVSYVLARRLYPELRPTLGVWNSSELRLIFAFSLFTTLLNFSGTIILSTDSVVIGSFLSASAITVFAIGSMPCIYGEGLVSALSYLIVPRVSALDAVGGRDAVAQLALRAGRAATLVMLPITITFVLRGARFLELWMGSNYGPLSGPLLRPLAIALTFVAAAHMTTNALVGLNRHREVVPFALAEAALNLGLSVYWIRTMGLMGVALGTALPRLTRALLVAPWMLRRHAGVSYSTTWLEMWIRPLAAAAPFGVATWLVEEWWPAHDLVTYFAQIVAVLPLMAAGAWFVALEPADRRMLQVAASRHVPWAVAKS